MYTNKPQKYVSKDQAIIKLRYYCAYQERCHKEVRTKLLSLNIYGDDLEDIILHLIEEDFLNETRFAQAYARGKFNFKHWGRIKISIELKRRQISPYLIRLGLKEIDEEEYLNVIQLEVDKYAQKISNKGNIYEQRNKTVAYLMRKGFEVDIIKPIIYETIKEQ